MDQRRDINRRRAGAQAGLTLVELLVVLTILAFAAFVVVLNAPPSRPPARDAAERFAARLQAALDAAVIEGAAYRLEVEAVEYRIARYEGERWTPVFHENLAATDGVLFRAELAEAAASNALALNGEDEARGDSGERSLDIPLDPFAGGLALNAYFESRRGDWGVAMAPDGTLTVTQQ